MEHKISMKILSLTKYAIGITTTAALLAACSSGGSSVYPAGVNLGAGPTVNGIMSPASFQGHTRGMHTIIPAKKKKKNGSQYISQFYGGNVLVFDYPKSTSSTGTISGITDADGECSNNSKTFWVVSSGNDNVEEFKKGGTAPINTLSETTGEPAGCSVNKKGDVAVSILAGGDVIIFKGGKGTGTVIGDGFGETYFVGYDAKGNLFADGKGAGSAFALAELPVGKTAFEPITTSNSVSFPGQVQWDGKYLTVDDQNAHAIYQYSVSGTTATLKGTVSLTGSGDCVQTWISGKLVYCPDFSTGDAAVYAYPKGGTALATFTGSFDGPIGSVALK